MARSRTLKPDFFDDLTLADCDLAAAFFYAGIWCFTDGQGLIEADARVHKKNIFPYREEIKLSDIEKWIDQLVSERRLFRVEHEGRELLFCPTLKKHSRVYDDEPKKFNVPDDLLLSSKQSADILRSSADILRSSAEKVRRKPADDVKAEAAAEEEAEAQIFDFEKIYRAFPKRHGTRKGEGLRALKVQAKHWRPEDYDSCLLAAQNYCKRCELAKTDPEFIMLFKTWAGSIEDPKWREWIDWKPTPSSSVKPPINRFGRQEPAPIRYGEFDESQASKHLDSNLNVKSLINRAFGYNPGESEGA